MSYINAFKIFLFILVCWSTLAIFIGGAKGMYQVHKRERQDKRLAIPIMIIIQILTTIICTVMIKFGSDFLVL